MDASPPRKKRRFLKWTLVLVVVLALIGVVGPMLLAPVARGMAVKQIEQNLAAKAALQSLSFDLAGGAHLGGLELKDLDGRPVLAVQEVDVEAGVLRAVRGGLDADVTLKGLVVHVRQEADGSWNLANLPRTSEGAAKKEPKPEKPKEEGEPRFVRLNLSLADAHVIVHGAEGETELTELRLDAKVDRLNRPATFSFSTNVRGPAGEGGRVSASGEAVAFGDTRANVTLDLENVLLAALEPALKLVAPVESIAGTLAGKANVRAGGGGGTELAGDVDIALTGLRLVGTQESAPPVELERIALTGRADQDDAGAGTNELAFTVGEALRLGWAGTSQRAGEAMRLQGELGIDGDLAELTRLAAAWAPMREGLEVSGKLVGKGVVDVDTARGGVLPGSIDFNLRAVDVAARGASGEQLDLGELTDLRMALAAQGGADGLVVRSLEAVIGPARLTGEVHVAGLEGAPQSLDLAGTKLELDADLGSLVTSLAQLADTEGMELAGSVRWTIEDASATDPEATAVVESTLVANELVAFGYGLASEPVRVRTRLTTVDEIGWIVDGTLDAARLDVTPAEGAPLSQRNVRLEYRARSSGEPDAPLELEASFNSDTAEARVASVAAETTAERSVYDLVLAADLERVVADLGAFLGLEGYRAGGALDVTARAALAGDDVELSAQAVVQNLVWVEPAENGGLPRGLEDPRVEVDLDVVQHGTPGAEDVVLTKLDVRSDFINGGVTGRMTGLGAAEAETPLVLDGVRGAFTYVPDRLGVVLGPWLPGKLSGAEEESLTLALDGEIAGFDLASLTQAAGEVELGLGLFETTGLATSGRVKLRTGEGAATVNGDLAANGGTLKLDASLRPEDFGGTPAGAKLSVDLETVRATAGLAPLLGFAHPLFAAASKGLDGGGLAGLLSGSLDLDYGGPMSLADLSKGWDELKLDKFSGKGVLRIDGAALSSSPLLAQMFSALGLDASKELALEPIGFDIDAGRLKYDGAWGWNLSGVPTTFTGSVGLDKSLKMKWNVPVTDGLIGKYSFLESLKGQTIEVPVRGTTDAPKLEWKGLMDELAKKAVGARIGEELGLGEVIEGGLGEAIEGGLGGLLGGGRDEKPEEKVKPADLLARANELWDAGDKKEARKLYEQLKKDHKDSGAFQNNKALIKERIGDE